MSASAQRQIDTDEHIRAWTYAKAGPVAEVLKLNEKVHLPSKEDLQAYEVLVKVSYVSLFAPTANLIAAMPRFTSSPSTPEFQFSGEIVAVGSALSSSQSPLSVGEQVYGMINPKKPGYGGVLAEYIIAPVDAVIRKPDAISMESAAGLAGNGCTCIGFAEKAGLLKVESEDGKLTIQSKASGKKILVTGGSTATGQCMIQIARYLVGSPGSIVTTASPRNTELVKSLGADEVIDYTAHPDLYTVLADEHSGEAAFDAIFDISGSDQLLFPKCTDYLKKDGHFVFGGAIGTTHKTPDNSLFGTLVFILRLLTAVMSWLLAGVRPVILGGIPRKNFFHSGSPSQRNMILTNWLVEQGILNVKIDSIWKMADVIEAYDHLLNERVAGKVVIDVQAR